MDRATGQQREQAGADETRDRLLEAAARIFAEKGYARATTRALAEAAGVNEVTLFRHFGSKANLFAAVVDAYAAPGLSASLGLALTGDLENDLTAMGSLVLHLLLERRESMRMMLCEAEHFEEVRQVLAQNPRRLRQVLADYLRGQQAPGKVRPLHVEAAAQAFWGMFFAYSFGSWLMDEEMEPPLSIDELVREFVSLFVKGIAAG
ncbi:MAG: TetR/AcrR family transcriptional regulator [Anaerolineae bacterium]|nr:TetR/AcrR family transcriptional regulator [Anaerolineae bacterium]